MDYNQIEVSETLLAVLDYVIDKYNIPHRTSEQIWIEFLTEEYEKHSRETRDRELKEWHDSHPLNIEHGSSN